MAELARYFFSATKSFDDFDGNVKSLFDELLTDDSSLVKLVSGLDSICAKCDHVDKSCSVVESGDEDSFVLGEYGLSVNQSIKFCDLIDVLVKYRDNIDNKYMTPRPVFYDLYEINDECIRRIYSK